MICGLTGHWVNSNFLVTFKLRIILLNLSDPLGSSMKPLAEFLLGQKASSS